MRSEEVGSKMNEVIVYKTMMIERGINRIHEVYAGNRDNLNDFTKQDSIIFNIQRACEASIDYRKRAKTGRVKSKS